MVVLFVAGVILTFVGWSMTGKLAGMGLMLLGLALLLAALLRTSVAVVAIATPAVAARAAPVACGIPRMRLLTLGGLSRLLRGGLLLGRGIKITGAHGNALTVIFVAGCIFPPKQLFLFFHKLSVSWVGA